LSAILWKKEFYDELVKKFPNLVSPMSKSLTSVGFTNNFTKYQPKSKPTTSINIFKKPTECYGDACDPTSTRVLNSEVFVKCQCLKPEDEEEFADSFKTVIVRPFKILQEGLTLILG
jgi:hypothetical protein